jgi:cbb3-type cytochrome oxidase subunit 3
MYKDLLQSTPLMLLPLAALFIFLAVFVAVVARAMTRGKGEIDQAAALPLAEDGRHVA